MVVRRPYEVYRVGQNTCDRRGCSTIVSLEFHLFVFKGRSKSNRRFFPPDFLDLFKNIENLY